MKKLTFISGAASVSITIIGSLFSIFHFPGGFELIIVGLSLFALVFVPSLAIYLYDRIK